MFLCTFVLLFSSTCIHTCFHILVCGCTPVFVYTCIHVLAYSCSRVLVCTPVLLCFCISEQKSTTVIMYSCTPELLYSTTLIMYLCTPELMYSCTHVLLNLCISELMYSSTSTDMRFYSSCSLVFLFFCTPPSML